jgi:hypothetical protein
MHGNILQFNLPPSGEYGKCSSSKFVYQYPDTAVSSNVPTDGLGYFDGEDYQAGFYTGAYFGCIHWQPKNEEH